MAACLPHRRSRLGRATVCPWVPRQMGRYRRCLFSPVLRWLAVLVRAHGGSAGLGRHCGSVGAGAVDLGELG